jgi:hypothetical protein
LLEQGLKFVTHGEIEQIMAGIQDTIARRRAAGEYPAGLETELEAEFASILALTHRGEADRADALEKLLEEAKRSAPEVSGLTPLPRECHFSIFCTRLFAVSLLARHGDWQRSNVQ